MGPAGPGPVTDPGGPGLVTDPGGPSLVTDPRGPGLVTGSGGPGLVTGSGARLRWIELRGHDDPLQDLGDHGRDLGETPRVTSARSVPNNPA